MPLKIRSLVGLIPLLAVQTLEPESCPSRRLPAAVEWFVDHRPIWPAAVACMKTPGRGERRLLAIVDGDRLRRI